MLWSDLLSFVLDERARAHTNPKLIYCLLYALLDTQILYRNRRTAEILNTKWMSWIISHLVHWIRLLSRFRTHKHTYNQDVVKESSIFFSHWPNCLICLRFLAGWPVPCVGDICWQSDVVSGTTQINCFLMIFIRNSDLFTSFRSRSFNMSRVSDLLNPNHPD